MATGERHRRCVRDEEPQAEIQPKKRKRAAFLWVLALLAALVWFLPLIIINSPALGWLIRRATSDVNGAVTVQSASASWLSPISVRGVEVCDAAGQPALSVPTVVGDRSLAAMLWNYPNLGRFRIEQPKLAVVLRADGNNLEDILANYLTTNSGASTETSTGNIGFALEIVDGVVSVTDQVTGQTRQIDKLALGLDMSSGTSGPMTVRVTTELPDAQRPGKLTAAVKMAATAGEASVVVEQIPLVFLRPLVDRYATQTSLAGQCNGNLSAVWGHAQADKNGVSASLIVDGLTLATSSLNIREPKVDMMMVGQWEPTQRRLTLQAAHLACSALNVQAGNMVVAVPAQGPVEVAGALQYQTALASLQQWFADQTQPAAWKLGGQIRGAVQFTQANGQIRGENTTEVANLAVTDAAGGQFLEPRMLLTARGGYDNQTGALQLEQCALQSSIVGVDAKGRTGTVHNERVVQVDGQVTCDMGRLVALFRPYFGPGMVVTGRAAAPAWYHGPLALERAEAGAGVRWDAANIYGFCSGPGEIQATLAQGVVRVNPLNLTVNKGQVHLAPQLCLTTTPMELSLPPGPVVQNVQLDPTMCSWWMKFIAPALADVPAAKGAVSINLKNCRVPLTDPAAGDIEGELAIHSAQVGSGPLTRAFSGLLGKETPVSLRNGMVVPFRMVNRRVYHQGLELTFANVTVRTSGSVGFDQTVQMVAEMPVPAKWLENNPLAATLRNQTLQIPLGGTLSKPVVDQRVVEQLAQRFMVKATHDVLQNAVNQQLNRLLVPRK